MTERRRAGVGLVVGVAAIVVVVAAGGLFAFDQLFADAPAAPVRVRTVPVVDAGPVAAAEAPVRDEAVVVGVEGRVERRTASGDWSAVAAGDRLLADDSLRTDTESRAELTVGGRSRLTVTASTELKIRELSRVVHQLRLTKGRLVANYDADGERVLRIEDEHGSAVAETKAAKFSVLSNGRALAVATDTGTVNLAAAGRAVEVTAGQQAFARAGEGPSTATPIPAEVLLKIARARAGDQALCAVIEGTIDPGSELEIDGEAVPTDGAGRFKARVVRRAGRSSARVAVRDPSGKAREKEVGCSPVAAAPALDLEMKWDGEPDAG